MIKNNRKRTLGTYQLKDSHIFELSFRLYDEISEIGFFLVMLV